MDEAQKYYDTLLPIELQTAINSHDAEKAWTEIKKLVKDAYNAGLEKGKADAQK